ncbi:hypothetical protein M1247_11560 [Mycobacterium sp. 21AC1]|uniref:hypothetical protein n=1 Tax=[Mycobacterium] appelbergii TaxID=2939269 RepID=UPI0029393B2C|nr:hypothetical protein [Mycobacterium sp. 21AC1]MDV3125552.1 hypothetical protein [Mycobacterium sp. 21AC1]
MTRRALVEIVVAVAAGVGAVLSWVAARSVVEVAPVLPGEPATTTWTYSAPMLVLSLLLATLAGVLAVLAVARLRR